MFSVFDGPICPLSGGQLVVCWAEGAGGCQALPACMEQRARNLVDTEAGVTSVWRVRQHSVC